MGSRKTLWIGAWALAGLGLCLGSLELLGRTVTPFGLRSGTTADPILESLLPTGGNGWWGLLAGVLYVLFLSVVCVRRNLSLAMRLAHARSAVVLSAGLLVTSFGVAVLIWGGLFLASLWFWSSW